MLTPPLLVIPKPRSLSTQVVSGSTMCKSLGVTDGCGVVCQVLTVRTVLMLVFYSVLFPPCHLILLATVHMPCFFLLFVLLNLFCCGLRSQISRHQAHWHNAAVNSQCFSRADRPHVAIAILMLRASSSPLPASGSGSPLPR